MAAQRDRGAGSDRTAVPVAHGRAERGAAESTQTDYRAHNCLGSKAGETLYFP